jgi:hypothetical protein
MSNEQKSPWERFPERGFPKAARCVKLEVSEPKQA